MDAQPSLPTLEQRYPALILGPVFVTFELRGPPGHKGRHRSRLVIPRDAWLHTGKGSYITREGAKKIFIQQYPDPATEAFEATMAEAGQLFMRGRQPTGNPLALLVHIFRPIPESWSKKDKAMARDGAILPTSRPDGDNYLKLVQDALNEVVYADDSQIIDARVIKRYDESPAMRIEIREFLPAIPNR
jgi:Holliday junction resolvase RusA-like endonuclease